MRGLSTRTRRAVLMTVGALLILPAPAASQYFGRNKVQYEKFDFEILQTEHFDVHFYPEERQAAEDAARMAERWYSRLSSVFAHQFEERKPLILYADKPDFQQTNTTFGFISEATGGFTESLKDRVVLPFAETYGDTDHVLGHELVHAFQYDIATGQRIEGTASLDVLPLWAIEGLAEYLSVGRRDPHTAMWMRDAILRDDLPDIRDLSRDPKYFPYRWGQALWAYIGGSYGDEVLPTLYRSAGGGGFGRAIDRTLGMDEDTLSARWHQALKTHYGPLLEGRTVPAEAGEVLLPGEDEDSWALAPVLSPDGSRFIFLSQRELFTIELFIADARTGEILGRLAETDRNPHFDALAFTNTAGAWSPDSRRFAFVTFAEGDHEIAIADVDSRRVERTIDLDPVGAVSSVAWSPDGSELVLSGTMGGIPDLWRVDLADGRVEQLTDDRWAELHPEFSPDGRTIAFATDRGGDLDVLRFAPLGLGFLDRDTGEIRVVRPFGDAKHINPRYAPDGGSLYFISDREGFSDVYRLELGTGAAFQVTRMATGVSGITGNAPVLSISRSGRLAFSVFDEGGYLAFGLSAEMAQGEPVAVAEPPAPAGVLPPTELAPRVLVASYLEDTAAGLPARTAALPTEEYKPRLRLDYVAPPSAGVAVDQFGTQVGGSVGFFWSDMLGNHQLITSVGANGGLKDIGGEVLYADLGSRTNWGVRAGHIPYRVRGTRITRDEFEGQQVLFYDLITDRAFFDRAAFLVDRPFSLTRRIESEIGFTRVSFDREVLSSVVINGVVVAQQEFDEPTSDALNLYHASAALVTDYSFFGFTSPVRGGRSRFELEGNLGSLQYVNALADWRRYWFARPVTFALRGLYYGRYGPDSEDDALTPLFLGQESLVRGYESGTFEVTECSVDPEDPFACPEFDRLIGSRLGLVKAELRFPLVGVEGFGLITGGFLPVELSLFADGGVAWNSEEGPELSFARRSFERIPVFSAGSSMRVNFMGAFVVEIYYAYPFQRPEQGGHFGFQLAPGW
ncbi:MAG TPA: BamA/TamA family outer membrane protein [Gemmatimonadota bacterium]|nr:BamA/TamA family outer membrane protein [Gemmatimonadota bacterium]